MIGCDEAIMQDQLIPSRNAPGWVNVIYPRGSQTVLSIDTNVLPPVVGVQPLHVDGRYEQFWVRSDGNLQTMTDRPSGGTGAIVLGLDLVPLQ